MTMNQMPSRVASALTDVDGTETTTIPAARLISPKAMAHPRLPRTAHDPSEQGHHPLDDPHDADEEARWRPW